MASSKNAAVLTPNEWARKTARRLRGSHASFSDQPFEKKREYLKDELEYELSLQGAESGALREDYLTALGKLFPVFDEVRLTESNTASQKSQSPVDKVLEGWSEATEEERASILSRLGLKSPESAPVTGLPPEIRLPAGEAEKADLERTIGQLLKVFSAPEGSELSFTRLCKLLGILAHQNERLHLFLWEFWTALCPNDLNGEIESHFTGGLQRALSDYLLNYGDVSSRQVSQEIEQTKLLALAICQSIQKGGEEFGRQFGNRFAPDEIEAAVIMEDSGGDPQRVRELEKKSWIKYRQLAKNLTPEAVDDELQILIGRIVAAWMKRNQR